MRFPKLSIIPVAVALVAIHLYALYGETDPTMRVYHGAIICLWTFIAVLEWTD